MWLVVGAKQAGLSISGAADLLGFSCAKERSKKEETPHCRERSEENGQTGSRWDALETIGLKSLIASGRQLALMSSRLRP